jgi:hypothetical protein
MRLNATTLNLATMPPALPVSHLAHARSRKGEGAPDSGKPASVNLPADDDACLRWIAASEDVPLAEVARAAMNDYFAWRMGTPELAEQIAAAQRRESTRREHTFAALLMEDAGALGMPTAAEVSKDPTEWRAMSIRLSAHYVRKLTAFALVDDNSLADQVRAAVDLYLERMVSGSRAALAAQWDEGKVARPHPRVHRSRPATLAGSG